MSGRFEETAGVTPDHIPATIYDVELFANGKIDISTKPDEKVFIFLIAGDAVINRQLILSKTAVLFGKGDSITVSSKPKSDLRFIFFSGMPLYEPIAWGGPIVMNTEDELERAFDELRRGIFIKHN